MVDETKKAPTPVEDKPKEALEGEDKTLDSGTSEPVAEPKVEPEKVEAEKEETVGEVLKVEEGSKAEDKSESRTVPEAVFLEQKNANKELKRDVKELKELIESGASQKEVSKELDEIAEEYGVDPGFIKTFEKKIRNEVARDMEEKLSSKIGPMEAKERTERIDKVFNIHYAKALEARPEFKDIAQAEVIKTLSLDPANAKKTFSDLLVGAYGHLVSGKRTLETTKGRSGDGVITEIDFARANSDPEYFQEIMADPELKAKYNKDLGPRLQL